MSPPRQEAPPEAPQPAPLQPVEEAQPEAPQPSPPQPQALRRRGKAPPSAFFQFSETLPGTVAFRQAKFQQMFEEEKESEKAFAKASVLPKIHNAAGVYEAMRKQFQLEQFSKWKVKADDAADLQTRENLHDLRLKCRMLFSKLGFGEKVELIDRILAKGHLLDEDQKTLSPELLEDLTSRKAWLLAEELRDGLQNNTRYFCKSKTLLCTWNPKCLLLRKGLAPGYTVENGIQDARNDATAQTAWDAFCLHVQNMSKYLRAEDWTAAAEISTQTLTEQRELRVHLQAAFTSKKLPMICTQTHAKVGFSFAHAPCIGNTSEIAGITFGKAYQGGIATKGKKFTTRKDQQPNVCHYYLQCEAKIGSVWTSSSTKPFMGYAVKPAWISSWLQAAFATHSKDIVRSCAMFVHYFHFGMYLTVP